MSALTLTDVTAVRGGRQVLDRIDASFAPGRLTAVIGPNGAGKSTLLEVAAGLLQPQSGGVRLGGVSLDTIGRRQLARRRAYLPQSPRVEWPISVERVVALGLTPSLPAFGGLPPGFQSKIDRALAAFDLSTLRQRPATMISGGELARVMLARATVSDPEILIVDEPTAGLDPRHALTALKHLRSEADSGRTIVMAIHDLNLALRVADDVVAIKDGRVLVRGLAEIVLTESCLEGLYDVKVRLVRDTHGAHVRFLD